jgi:hypothetical protein
VCILIRGLLIYGIASQNFGVHLKHELKYNFQMRYHLFLEEW